MTTLDIRGVLPRESTLESVKRPIRVVVLFLLGVVVGLVKAVVPHMFTLAGLAAFCIAAFTVSVPLGFLIVGVSFLVLELRVAKGE